MKKIEMLKNQGFLPFKFLRNLKMKTIITRNIEKIIEILNSGGVVIYPTDTVFGIGCRIDNENSVKRIYKIKNRSLSQPLSVAFLGFEQLKDYVNLNPEQATFIFEHLDRPYTFIVEKNERISEAITNKSQNVGVRVPLHSMVKEIIKAVGPIITTSANISGKPAPRTFCEIDAEIMYQADAVLKGECYLKKPSKIFDLTAKINSSYKIIRG